MEKMELAEAVRILTLVAEDPDHGTRGAWEDQDAAACAILKELSRLRKENKTLRKELDRLEESI